MYGFTREQMECRAAADCNRERLKEHRQCEYCHLIFDCKEYKKLTGKSLCQYVDSWRDGLDE